VADTDDLKGAATTLGAFVPPADDEDGEEGDEREEDSGGGGAGGLAARVAGLVLDGSSSTDEDGPIPPGLFRMGQQVQARAFSLSLSLSHTHT
jgi:hypothetical protein